MSDVRRALPSVSALLESAEVRAVLADAPRSLVVSAVRATVAAVRTGARPAPDGPAAWADTIAHAVATARRSSLRPVINATGVVLHTNLGRAPLARAAIDAMATVASGYSNLEYDLASGERRSRYEHCAALLRELTGAEDALVVNNCAAALVLALDTVASGREAVLSRGELVEIGDGFRVHEIMAKSGATLRDVGATNRTHLADYARAINPRTGALLKVHRSNFAIAGYTADVGVGELLPLAREHDLPILHDLGSGLLIPLDDFGLRGEPTAAEALAAGEDRTVVMMSGDKLLGGPQAGLILGPSRWIAAMRRNPLARSCRVDKTTLAALAATLALYRDPAMARRDIPILAMLGAPIEVIRARAERCLAALRRRGIAATLVETRAAVGAGAFPTTELPSVAIALAGDAERWHAALRTGDPAVVGRVNDGRLLLDLRTVPDDSIQSFTHAVAAADG